MDIAIRAALAFVFIFLLFRLLGRRELSSLEPFDLILIVVIGDLIQQGVTQSDMSFTGGVIAVGVFALLTILSSWLGFRFPRLRPVLDGSPLIVVENGKLIEDNLRRERVTPEEVAAAARQQGIASLDDVRWAVLEGSGRISFIKR
jgi:uncharacterized membrane protein YcaP (DUF421 family)